MKTADLAVASVLLSQVPVFAQTQNPHERHFERAHPTPVIQPGPEPKMPMVPMIQSVPFPSLFLNVNTITEETDPLPVQNESSIAVNPTNPLNLIASAVDYRDGSSTWAYHSTDGGVTWENTNLGKARTGWTSTNDPSVCFDHEGRGYLCYGGFSRDTNAQFGENGVFVSITTNGGTTWNPKHIPVITHTGQQTVDSSFEDKYYIHVDTGSASPFRSRLYIPWKRVVNRDSSTQIVISFSTDRGLTWSVPVNVGERLANTSDDPTFGQSFPLARTSPDGSVHVVWNSGTENSIRHARSSDGGASWTEPVIIQTYKPFGEKIEVANQINSRVKGVVRAEAYPTLVIDNTGGLRNGWFYLCWAADNYPNVYFSRSTDNGDSWSLPQIVHSDTANDQFWPWVALDPTNGDLAVMYFDSRDDADNSLVNCYVSYSSDGGYTWTDRRVGDGINDLRQNPFQGNTFAGDYSGCDFFRGRIYPSWVDMRNVTTANKSDNDVYTSVISVDAPEPPAEFTATTLADEPTSILLEWSAISQRSFGQPLDTANTTFVLYRNADSIIQVPVSILLFKDTGLVRYNEYRYKLVAVNGSLASSPRFASAYAGGSSQPGIPTIVNSRGNENDSISVTITIPATRLDGTTKLINLDTIRFKVNSTVFDFDVELSDTGKTMTFDINVGKKGWYEVSAAAVDQENNISPFSTNSIVYTGTMEFYSQNFDSRPNYLIRSGTWGITNNFYFSPPAAFTESPEGKYKPSAKDTVYLYPISIMRAIPEDDAVVISWRAAAFVDPLDTMFLEGKVGFGFEGEWNVLAWWNASQDARWMDTTKGDDAWRYGSVPIPLASVFLDTFMLRMRFKSNVTKQSDGFYFDDLRFELTSSVDDTRQSIELVYPQPASTHAIVGLRNDLNVIDCKLVDIQGIEHSITWTQTGQTLVLDLLPIPSRTYTVIIQMADAFYYHQIVVIK